MKKADARSRTITFALRLKEGDLMNKQDIIRDIKRETGTTWPSISQIAQYMGIGRDSARELVYGLECFETGKSKKYLANDIAERILARRTV